jgi:hypothetical protein
MTLLPLLLLGCAYSGAVSAADTAAKGSGPGDSSAGDSGAVDTGDTGSVGTLVDPYSFAAKVNQAEITATIEDLAGLGTRYTFSDGDEAAAAYLRARFEAMGLGVIRDPFSVDGVQAENLIVEVPGSVDPDVVYVLSAHYDSTSNAAATDAPGADDNASGVAAVLEAARLLSAQPLRYSAWFVLTAAEEQGSLGSAHLTEWMVEQGVDVRGVIAPDMIGYWPLGDSDAMDILGDEASALLVADMEQVADRLGVASKAWIEHDYCYGDDHTNYQDAGFPALTPMDCVEAHNVRGSGEETPHYHRATDTVDTLHLGFTTRVVQVTTVTFASWVQPLE